MAALPKPSARPKRSAERRRRRATVESTMIDGTRHMQIVAIVAEQFGTSPRTIRSDIRIFRRRWAKVDTEKAGARRERTVLALERNARSCRAVGDLHGERQALRDIGRLLGMGIMQLNVHQDNRKQEVHLHQARLPPTDDAKQAWLDEYVQAKKELDRPVLEAEVIKVDTNGHAQNEQADGGATE